MKSFANMLPPAADCKRDGSGFQPIDSRKLCRGDIVQIKAGQKIPADIRVITASDDMKVEQSALTGEPDHIKKNLNVRMKKIHWKRIIYYFLVLCVQQAVAK